jgi:hypothetical protein
MWDACKRIIREEGIKVSEQISIFKRALNSRDLC